MPPKKAKPPPAAVAAGDVTDEIAALKAKLLDKLSDKGADLDDLKKKAAAAAADTPDEPARKKPKKAAAPISAPASSASCSPPLGACTEPTSSTSSSSSSHSSFDARWQVQLGGSWVDFPVDTAKALEDAYQAKKPDVTLPPQRGQVYRITYGDMKQTNVESKKQRTVRRLEPVGKPPAPTPAAAPAPASTPVVPIAAATPATSVGGRASPPPDEDPKSPHSPDTGSTAGLTAASADEEAPLLEGATCTLVPVEKDSEEFWDLEEKFLSALQGRNEDYVAKRLERKLKPISFVLKAAEKVVNPVLEKRFAIRKAKLAQLTQDKAQLRERVSFHGTHPRHLPNMCRYSLLRFKHPLNPCKTQVDDGYFGSNRKGVYVSRYADYTFKYANRQVPLEPKEQCKILQFRTLPGRSKHIPKMCGPIDPTDGFDSHSSPSFLEWFLFNEDQLLPEYILTVEAKEDTRTAADDM